MKMKKVLLISIPVIVATIGIILFFVLSNTKTYTISFDSNGGSVVESQNVKEGDYAKEPEKPTREKYSFIEWTKDGLPFNFNTVIDSDIHLVANWKKVVLDEFEVTIDPKNGEEVTKVKVLENNKLEEPAEPKYKGYLFVAWVVDDLEYDFDEEVTESFTLEAKWEKENAKYTISFDSDGGSKVFDQKIDEGEKATKPSDPSREDYTFVEWQLNGKTYDFESEVTSNVKLKAKWKAIEYVQYKNNAFSLKCHEKNSTVASSVVKPGDKIECSLDYEVYSGDDISIIKYTLKYGKGLKLIESPKGSNIKVDNDNYKITNKNASNVGNAGNFTFEVVDISRYNNIDDFNVSIDDIKFITAKNNYYSNSLLQYKHVSIWEKMSSSLVYEKGGFTLECLDKNNQPLEKVVNGDIITCEAYLEVSEGDEIKYLSHSFSNGNSLEKISSDIPKEINEYGHYIADTPVRKLYLGKNVYKVVNENNPHMLFVEISGTFTTEAGRNFSPEMKTIKYKNGNTSNQSSFKNIALDIIDKARKDLEATNKLEAGYYYITTGSTKQSPLGGSINYYSSSCSKIGSTLCKRDTDSACNATSRTHIEVIDNNGEYEYRICLTTNSDYAHIDGKEKDLLNKDDYSMIYFAD